MTTHQSHPEVLKRLKRAHGHLAKTIEMVEAESPCVSVAQQLQAVVGALVNAKKVFIQDHIDHCLESSLGKIDAQTKSSLDEFKEITRYL